LEAQGVAIGQLGLRGVGVGARVVLNFWISLKSGDCWLAAGDWRLPTSNCWLAVTDWLLLAGGYSLADYG